MDMTMLTVTFHNFANAPNTILPTHLKVYCTGLFLQIEFYEVIILYWVNMVVAWFKKEKDTMNNKASNMSITSLGKIKVKRFCWHYM
jgi:hypothetical protein